MRWKCRGALSVRCWWSLLPCSRRPADVWWYVFSPFDARCRVHSAPGGEGGRQAATNGSARTPRRRPYHLGGPEDISPEGRVAEAAAAEEDGNAPWLCFIEAATGAASFEEGGKRRSRKRRPSSRSDEASSSTEEDEEGWGRDRGDGVQGESKELPEDSLVIRRREELSEKAWDSLRVLLESKGVRVDRH
jgi:hypothetical protein